MAAVAPAAPGTDGRRRLYAPTLLAGLLAAVGVSVGASRPWMTATATVPGLPTIHAAASGADLVPLAGALGVAMLAAYGAVVATRGTVRRALGVAVLVAAVVVLVASTRPPGATNALTSGLSAKGWSGGGYQTDTTWWQWLVVLCAAVAGASGAVTAAYGHLWADMGSRYDAPTRAAAPVIQSAGELSETDVWRAIDEGHDPTHDL